MSINSFRQANTFHKICLWKAVDPLPFFGWIRQRVPKIVISEGEKLLPQLFEVTPLVELE
jgi:hypothetical protein